ncbi:MAG: hypothetical protein V4644_00045 [Patescibacteria group bacterium]
MAQKAVTVRDLARITIRMAAFEDPERSVFELSLGRVRQTYASFIKERKKLKPGMQSCYPFSDSEWEVLNDYAGLWRSIKEELGIVGGDALRISADRTSIPFELWDLEGYPGVQSISHGMCLICAMHEFNILKMFR